MADPMLRLRRGVLFTPVLRYRHRDTRRQVVLIANMHMGDAGYWRVMRQRIGELEAAGWSVQREGLREAPAAAWAAATPAEREARQVLVALYTDQPAEVARRLGWVFQREGLPPGDGWVNADLADLEVIRAAGPANVVAFGAAAAAELAKAGRHAAAWQAVLYPLIWRRLARPRGVARLAPAAAEVHEVLLPQRSKLAAAAADPARDWVIIWGAGHEEEITAELAAAGWEQSGPRRWLIAGRLPSLPRTAAGFAAVIRAVLADSWRAAWAAQNTGRQPPR